MKLRLPSLFHCFVLSAVLAGAISGIRQSGHLSKRMDLAAEILDKPILVEGSSSSSSVASIYIQTDAEFSNPVFSSSSSKKSSSKSSVSSISSLPTDFWKDFPEFVPPQSSSSTASSEATLSIPLYPTPLPPAYQASSSSVPVIEFSDISRLSPQGNAVYLLAERGILSGFPDGTFRPDVPVNRAEITKLILRARSGNADIPDLVYDGKFSDVAAKEWYVRYVMVANQLGIISGYPDGTFKAGYIVNTAEFLKMISVAFHLEENSEYSFQDVAPLAWYAKYAGIASSFNLFPERPVPFLQPERYLTRGEVAYALSKLLHLQ